MNAFKPVSLSVLALCACAPLAWADDEEEAAEKPAAADAAALPAMPKKPAAAVFTALPFCRDCSGAAEVLLPGKGQEWTAVEDGKFYPLGASFRTRRGGKLTLAFGKDSFATIEGDASFATREQPYGQKTRTLILGEGTLDLDLPANLPEELFFVTAPDFTVKNLAGQSRYVIGKTSTGDRAVVRCVTGSLALSGRHFEIPQMRAANELVLLGEHDHLVTILENTSGDYTVKLNQGVRLEAQVAEDGSSKQKAVEATAELKFSPKMKINIHRAVPSVGERMSVFILAFDAAGNPMGSGVSFCEGRAEINSGTLVTKSESEAEALAKKAAEAAETTEEESGEEEKKEESGEE